MLKLKILYLIATALWFGCLDEKSPDSVDAAKEKTSEQKQETDTQVKNAKPPIVEVFACSDYCPGPQEKYLEKVYEGVEDAQECIALGGRPSTFTGWGTFHICIAE
jgi:hypothetical protein